MIFRNVLFWIHRQLYLGFISLSCILITAEFETTSGTFERFYLKLYNFDEFLDYCNGKSTLDRAILKRVTMHLNDCSKHRRDYLQLNLRAALCDECATEDEISWPAKDEAKQELLESYPFEKSFDDSRYKTTSVINWVAGDFLLAAMQFPLSGVAPYSRMLYFHLHTVIDSKFIYLNKHDGRGFRIETDYKPLLNRPTLKRKRTESEMLMARYVRLQSLLGEHKGLSIDESCLQSACEPPKQADVVPPVTVQIRSGLLKN